MSNMAQGRDLFDPKTSEALSAIVQTQERLKMLLALTVADVDAMTRAAAEYEGPVYMRILRNDVPDVTDEKQEFKIGRQTVIRQGSDVVVFAHGYMVYKSLKAAESLEKEGVSVRIVNVSTLKPMCWFLPSADLRRTASMMRSCVAASR